MTTDETTPRHALPLLQPGQAQKEMTHNAALIRLDIALNSAVEGIATDPDVLDPLPGQAWIVGPDAVGAFAGAADALALWTISGWELVAPVPGQQCLDRALGSLRVYDGTIWAAAPALTAPQGGGTIDAEARSAIETIIAAMVALRLARNG